MEHATIASPRAGPIATFASSRWTVPATIALALAVRLALIAFLPQTPFSDGHWYLLRAGELASGMGYQEAGHPTAFWPVGWPALLALFVGAFGAAPGTAIANLLATAAILALILWFARRVGAGELAARTAALLYALYPSPIVYAGTPLSETTSTAVAMAAFALLIAAGRRWPLLVASGLLFGIATLMRAQMMLFPIGAIVALLLVDRGFGWRDALRAALVVHLTLAAVVLPWGLRNERVLGAFVPVSTNGGVALFTGANDQATGDWFDWEHTPLWDETGIPFGQRIERQVELDRRFKSLATGWIETHPGRWASLGVRKMALLWRKDTDAFWSLDRSYPAERRVWTAVQALDQLYYMLLLALAAGPLATGLAAIWRRDAGRAPVALLACMPAFVTLTAFGFTGQIRYHFPAMPFVAVAAGIGVAALLRRRDAAPAAVNPRSGYGRPAA